MGRAQGAKKYAASRYIVELRYVRNNYLGQLIVILMRGDKVRFEEPKQY